MRNVLLALVLPLSLAGAGCRVAAETSGRIVSTPVERGTLVAAGAELVRIASTEADAQAREAEANAAQVEARLAMTGSSDRLDIERVPEVANARAASDQ